MSGLASAPQLASSGRRMLEDEIAAPRILRKALLARFTEERLLRLFSEGLLSGTVHTCIGQEFTGAVVSEFLQPEDTVFSNHRGHGHFLARTGDTAGLIAELMGREAGVCGGLGGSQHLCKDGFFTNGIQGGIVPVAAGLAMAANLAGRGAIAVVFIGDGTLGEGAIYEAFNLAAKWELPLLVVLEDNGVSQSTEQRETLAGSIAARAAGFGLDYATGDTWDWAALHATARTTVERVRTARRPALLHIKTFRLKAHSKGDDLRARDHIEAHERKDPVNVALSLPENAALIADVQAEVERATAVAKASPASPYVPPPPSESHGPLRWRPASAPSERLVHGLNRCFREALKRDEKLLMVGEDLESPYGGAFKVTQDLSTLFPGRVRNTPISEAGIVGLGSGLALAGWRPVVEIMFGDFLGLAFDQLVNHAAKFERMYRGQVHVDLVVRTPMGGRRGYGPTHSQTLDRHFLGAPGLRVLALHNLLAPEALYDPLFTTSAGPTLVIENKIVYGQQLRAAFAPGFERMVSDERFPTVWLRPVASRIDVTLLGYGGMSELLVTAAERLFEEHDLVAQVLCPMQIHPFSLTPLLPVVRGARHLVVAEEGQGFAGFGAEVVAQLAEQAPDFRGRIARVAPPADIVPSSGAMERAMLPSLETILARAVEVCA